MERFHVGRVSGLPLTAEESGTGRECKRRRFFAEEDAATFISVHLMKVCPDDVLNGEFYLDGPEVPRVE